MPKYHKHTTTVASKPNINTVHRIALRLGIIIIARGKSKEGEKKDRVVYHPPKSQPPYGTNKALEKI